jgi:hypothetical protein
MKSDLIGPKKEKAKPKYPYLGITECGRVVLFKSPGTGVVVHEPEHYWGIGYHSPTWAEKNFMPLKGKIILEN